MCCTSRVPDQNRISQACYIVEIYHSGLEPSTWKKGICCSSSFVFFRWRYVLFLWLNCSALSKPALNWLGLSPDWLSLLTLWVLCQLPELCSLLAEVLIWLMQWCLFPALSVKCLWWLQRQWCHGHQGCMGKGRDWALWFNTITPWCCPTLPPSCGQYAALFLKTSCYRDIW